MNNIDIKLTETLRRYVGSGIEQQVDYDKFYLYSLVTHSTAIEGSTVTEVENQLLFDEGIAQDVMMRHHIENLENRILQYHRDTDDTVNDTVKSEDFASLLLKEIEKHPEYTYEQYARALGAGRATVARHIKKLSGVVIRRIGSDKKGYWEILNN